MLVQARACQTIDPSLVFSSLSQVVILPKQRLQISAFAAKDELEGDSLEKWNTCVASVSGIGLDEEKAQKAVGQAFGWGKQAYWLDKKKDQVPDPEQVSKDTNYTSYIFYIDALVSYSDKSMLWNE